MKRNPESPWNPKDSCSVTPKEFENHVISWLNHSVHLNSFSIKHSKHLYGSGGDYEFDGVAELETFKGAKIIILIECKRYSRPVEREIINSLYSKLQDVGAHKAIIFSASGFQSGALTYAKEKGIACVTFLDGNYNYETKDLGGEHIPPPWIKFPKYAAMFLEKNNNSTQCTHIDNDHTDALKNWLNS